MIAHRRAAALPVALAWACDGDGEPPPPLAVLSGVAVLSTAEAPRPLWVVVQTLDARTLGQTATDAEGRYTISFELPDDVRRVLVGAALPSEPGRRSLAVVDLGTRAQALGRSGAGLEPAGANIDEHTTATALVLTTTGELEQQVEALRQRYAPQIEVLGAAWAGGQVSVCSAPASGSTAGNEALVNDVLREIAEGHPVDPGSVSVMQELFRLSAAGGTVEERLRAMQAVASRRIWSGNAPRLRGNVDFLIGLLGVPMARAVLAAREGEEFLGGIREDDLSREKLRRIAAIIGQQGWGNCREKAYVGAYIASLVPEIKQIAVVGVGRHGMGDHAMAIACLDGADAYDLSEMWATAPDQPGYKQVIPAGVEGRCWVVDPWLGPASDPVAGHVEAFGRDSTTRYKWAELVAFRRVLLEQKAGAPWAEKRGDDPRIFHCSGDGGCEPFTITPAAPTEPEPEPEPEPQPPPDAGVCPTYTPDGMSCGAALDGCIEGFYCSREYCSRETIACEQIECPPGAGRTYTLECCCTCWGDTTVVDVYDPCRPGFLLRCDPAP